MIAAPRFAEFKQDSRKMNSQYKEPVPKREAGMDAGGKTVEESYPWKVAAFTVWGLCVTDVQLFTYLQYLHTVNTSSSLILKHHHLHNGGVRAVTGPVD